VARVGSLLAAPAAEAAPASPWSQEFWVPHRAELIRILARDIDLIEAERDYMRLHLGQRSYLLHQTIGELERRLDPKEFIRLHRSTIVRRERIAGFKRDGEGAWLAELADGRLLRVGRTYLQNARAMVER
jgi:two-component system, LytTR family, response regulator AlgR